MESILFRSLPYPPDGWLPRLAGSGGHAAWLESRERGRYSYLIWDPYWVLEWDSGLGWRSHVGPTAQGLGADPWSGLEAALSVDEHLEIRSEAGEPLDEPPPFTGGAAGYFAYELARTLERLPALESRDPGVPLSRWAFADVVFALDHERRRAWVFSSGRPATGRDRDRRARERLEAAAAAWETMAPPSLAVTVPELAETAAAARIEGLEAGLDRAEYRSRFDRLHRYLVEGHLYQANLTVAFRAPGEVDPWTLYRTLSSISPAPYAALLLGDEASILSSSPEQFLSRRGRRLVTRPIKGTRRRGGRPIDDESLAHALIASPKDRAEHVMIVDVHRNDLGYVAEYGSVKVEGRWELESFASVHHLTSTISAIERPGLRPLDAVRAAFPAGSITGAPKVRAMEVLAELEPHARGVYTGALGWLGLNGDFDLAVAIRTVTHRPEAMDFPAGGGIVLDSDADAEYQEAWDKARAMWAAVQSVRESSLRRTWAESR